MRKVTAMAGMVSLAFLFVGCQSSGEELNAQDQETMETDDSELEEPEMDNDENGGSGGDVSDEKPEYETIEAEERYSINAHLVDEDQAFYTAYSINRDENGTLENSLVESDPSEQEMLSAYADLSVESQGLTVQFNAEGNELATTSAQTALFYESLFGVSDLYGIEEIVFLNSDGETDIIVAEREVNAPLNVEEERGATRGYYTVYDEALEETLFLSGGAVEEQVLNDEDELLSFSETVEKMTTIDQDGAFYDSAIVEGIEIVDARMDNGVASVQYTMEEESVLEADRTVFENAIQLAALDFDASKVELMNDTLQERVLYPLIE
ncbi:hypothetical protein MM326_02880 [Alkalihalobacillus sp. LMS6]|uniref:hypothetical protein n=1 Tax=Alkalihalobacillus sp. LMS6 TaxID=2924034 RepID=UPI0020D04A05|nr:hypothetical protein [Alkalihalobacillus sp. LMS6]UTR06994.1 hypothetical protein MM326_02880 [Alkalihalobacillus sp. LMS6]